MFQELKQLIATRTVAVHWDPSKRTRLYLDHGPQGIGGTVAQDHSREEQKPRWRAVHYSSRALTRVETNYGKVDRESLAVASMIQINNIYLYGTELKVVTDHQPLCALYKSTHKNMPTRVVRQL